MKFGIIDGDKNGIEGLRAIPVSTKEQALTEFIGARKRETQGTLFNAESSRSNAIIRLKIMQVRLSESFNFNLLHLQIETLYSHLLKGFL